MFISWCYCTYWRSCALPWEKVHNKGSSLCFSFRAVPRVKNRYKLRIQNLSDFLQRKVDTTVGPDCVLNEQIPWKLKKKTLFYLYLWFFLSVFYCLFLCNAGLGFCHFEGNGEARSPHPIVLLVVPCVSPCATSKPPRGRRGSGQGAAAFSLMPLPQRAPALLSTKKQNRQCWVD